MVYIPSSLSVNPKLSRNCRDPLGSQMWTPFEESTLASVEPDIIQSNSSITPLVNTRLVVSKGRVLFWREYLCIAPKIDKVPTPVLSTLLSPVSKVKQILPIKFVLTKCSKSMITSLACSYLLLKFTK